MLTFMNTRPHVTLSLFKCVNPVELAHELHRKLPAIAATLATAPTPVEPGGDLVSTLGIHSDRGVSAAGGWYRIEKLPSWYRQAQVDTNPADDAGDMAAEASAIHPLIKDVQNHLVVVAAYKSYLAVFASQDTMRQRICELVTTGVAGSDATTVALTRTGESIERKALEDAFVRGKTKSAWLEGLHVPTELKADRKVLSGPNLRYALDHFDDQSFTYSAAISEVLRGSQAHRVGISHAKGTLWTRATKAFDEFVEELRVLVDAIELGNTDPATLGELDRAGLPVVAKPAVTANLKDLDDGFDVGYEAPATAEAEVLLGGGAEEVAPMDEWQRHGSFVVDEKATRACAAKSQIVAVAHFDDKPIATLRFEPIRRTDTSVDILYRVLDYAVRKDDQDMVALDRSLAKRNTNLTLRYGSGHVVQNGALFALRFRDVIFDSWRWKGLAPAEDGKIYTVKAEKPTKKGGKGKKVYAPELIGKQDSLFCYMRNNVERLLGPKGDPVPDWHLLCDDGSGEIADFIGLSPNQRFVTFVHVKADSKGKATTISVTPFSEVVSQATKNLRNFDQSLLSAGIRERTTANNKNLVWRHDGSAMTRADFCDLLDDFRPSAQRHVILLQPRIVRTTWDKAVGFHRSDSKGAQVGRMLQLSGLLSSARNTFGKLGATMEVIGISA